VQDDRGALGWDDELERSWAALDPARAASRVRRIDRGWSWLLARPDDGAPDRVRNERMADADDPDRTEGLLFAHPVNRTSSNGVTGRPSHATASAGERLFAMVVADLSAQVAAGLRERPPLDASYFRPIDAEQEQLG